MLRMIRTAPRIAILVAVFASFQIAGSAQCLSCVQNLNLPPTYKLSVGALTDSYSTYSATFTSIADGYDISNGVYAAWCGDSPSLNFSGSSVGRLWSTYDPALPLAQRNANWDKVNWLLNNRPAGATARDMQDAIWLLLKGTVKVPPGTTLGNSLYQQALTAGAGFVPKSGQIVGVIAPGAAPGGFKLSQDMLVELVVPEFGRIGDFVWLDANANGIQEPGELGIDGVTLELRNSANDVIATQQTQTFGSQKGYYLFNNLPAGSYTVAYLAATVPAGVSPTLTGAGSVSTDSNPNLWPVTLPSRGADLTVDFGFKPDCTAALGNFVWNDLNGNGIQDIGEPGIAGVRLLLDFASNPQQVATTDSLGLYGFTGLCAGTYTVSVDPATVPQYFAPTVKSAPGSTPADDSDAPSAIVTLGYDTTDETIDFGYRSTCGGVIGDLLWHDLNRNGIQEPGEPGLNGITLSLKDSLGQIVQTAITPSIEGANGSYQFTGLCPGAYSVEYGSVPTGFQPTTSNAEGSSTMNDSNVQPAQVNLSNVNSSDLTIDFGFQVPCSGILGDFVWYDSNHNGIQDAGEPGIPGVIVNLRSALDHSLLATTTTNESGYYAFEGRCAATYAVEAVPPTGSGLTITGQSTAATDSNTNPTDVTLPADNAQDFTLDFGFIRGGIGDRVWNDVNRNGVQESGEAGLSGWAVSLKDASGATIATTSTGANGIYNFVDLAAGTYTVCVVPEADYVQTYDLDGVMTAHCALASLAAGQFRTDVDFGYQKVTSDEVIEGPFVTFTQGGWGSKPNGNNPGMLLEKNWSAVFGSAGVSIGGPKYRLLFTSAKAIETFLPQGGTPAGLKESAVDPKKSAAGVFAGQVLALTLSVRFSDAGVNQTGLKDLVAKSGPLSGKTVGEILTLANAALNDGSLPPGVSFSDLNGVVDAINNNFDGGSTDNGYLE